MPSKPSLHVPLDAVVLDLLACPACCGEVSVQQKSLVCAKCGRVYPIVHGIPVLIVERAELPGSNRA